MKRKLLVFALLVLSSVGSYASHLMGGQITSRNIGGLTYEVTLTAYRDTLGIPINTISTFHFADANSAWMQDDIVNLSAPSVFGNGVEEYTYTDTITFPASGTYQIWYEDCCRNGALLNIMPNSFYLNNTLMVDSTNSSPVFLNPPIPIAQLNTAFNYNSLPYDADGDSLSWSLDIPLDAGGVNSSGYSLPSSDTSMPFSINTATGEISFLPNLAGHFQVSVLVSEYRGGVKIGEIRRDMQIIVLSSANAPVVATANSNTFPFNGKNYNINIGSVFTLTVTGYDADNSTVDISADGAPFQFVSNPASFTSTTSLGTAMGVFTWSPTAIQARTSPYIMCVRLMEEYGGSYFASDITYSLRVGNFTGIVDQIKADAISSIYPNPAKGNFALELTIKKAGTATYRVRNLIGEQVAINTIGVNEGVNVIAINNLHLQSGKYFISLEQDGITTAVKGFEVTR